MWSETTIPVSLGDCPTHRLGPHPRHILHSSGALQPGTPQLMLILPELDNHLQGLSLASNPDREEESER